MFIFSKRRCQKVVIEAIANNLHCVTYLKKIKFEFSAVVIFFPVLLLEATCRKFAAYLHINRHRSIYRSDDVQLLCM